MVATVYYGGVVIARLYILKCMFHANNIGYDVLDIYWIEITGLNKLKANLWPIIDTLT